MGRGITASPGMGVSSGGSGSVHMDLQFNPCYRATHRLFDGPMIITKLGLVLPDSTHNYSIGRCIIRNVISRNFHVCSSEAAGEFGGKCHPLAVGFGGGTSVAPVGRVVAATVSVYIAPMGITRCVWSLDSPVRITHPNVIGGPPDVFLWITPPSFSRSE